MLSRAILALMLLIPSARAQMPVDSVAAGRARFAALITAEATRQGIPPDLADAVATVESAYDPAASGADGEVGLMQILPSTANMLGFRGSLAQLADPATNIRYGVTYLAGAWTATGGRLCDTLMKYRAGYGEQTMSLRSINYCRRARDTLAYLGSKLADGPGTELPPVTPEMLAAAAAADNAPRGHGVILMTPDERARLRAGHRTPEDTQRFWAREEAYIRSLQSRPAIRRLAMNR